MIQKRSPLSLFMDHARTTLLKGMCLSTLGVSCVIYAQSYSYEQAEAFLLQHSYTSQAQQALVESARLEKEAVKGLGLPRVDLNARAYAFHSEVDVPLEQFKQNLEDQLSLRVGEKMSELEQSGIPSEITQPLQSGLGQVIHRELGTLPDYRTITLEDEVFRPTVSVSMPLYTGGLTKNIKSIANISAERSILSAKQQEDTQRLELIQHYFNAQLQKQLLHAAKLNAHAMQQHLSNAQKLETQGMISKGQRMQFEVAYHTAQRLLQQTESRNLASQFTLKNLLQDSELTQLNTPLFINKNTAFADIDRVLAESQQDSHLIQKLALDSALAQENINAQSASKKPKVFAFGEYALDDHQNWIIGVMASYNLFSGINHNKKIQAAQRQFEASQHLTEKAKQELQNVIFNAYQEMSNAQKTHQLLNNNIAAAQENLRIQSLSYKEGMGTVSQVIDAENALYQTKMEIALNAYRYVMALSSLLYAQGHLENFKDYIAQQHTDYIVD